jgi:hypothetical protein
MYPENSQHLLRHFKDATSKPYGYLLVDLKPTTPQDLRMRIDVLDPIKQQNIEDMPHCPTDIRTDRMYHVSVPSTYPSITEKSDFQHITPTEDMPSYDDCGLVFENVHHLQRHVKKWCPENGKRRDGATMEVDEQMISLSNQRRKMKTIKNTTSLNFS